MGVEVLVHLRGLGAAVLLNEGVHDLVDQAERVHLTRINLFLAGLPSDGVDAVREFTHRADVGEDHIAVECEEFLVKIITFSGFG